MQNRYGVERRTIDGAENAEARFAEKSGRAKIDGKRERSAEGAGRGELAPPPRPLIGPLRGWTRPFGVAARARHAPPDPRPATTLRSFGRRTRQLKQPPVLMIVKHRIINVFSFAVQLANDCAMTFDAMIMPNVEISKNICV